MFNKLPVALTVVFMSFALFFAGCGSEIALKLEPGDSSAYKVAFETVQDYKFDQPSLNKVKNDQNVTRFVTTFTQEIQGINDDSSALTKITLKDIAIFIKIRNEMRLDFDSSREEDKKKAIYALVGKSYMINSTSDGKVSVADANDIREVRIKGFENIAKNFISDADIIKRHEVISLPDESVSAIQKGKGWSRVVASHPKVLEQKSFEKTYVLEGISGDNIAHITMTAFESDKPAEGPVSPDQFGPMAKMFDTQEKYSGEMKFDLQSGKVIDMNEKFVVMYIVSDTTKKESEKEPSTLTMGLTHTVDIEKID